MAEYSGTFAGKILEIQTGRFSREKSRVEKINALIEERLGAELQQGQGATASEIAKKINDKTLRQAEVQAAKALPIPRNPGRSTSFVINELNNTGKSKVEKEKLRNEVHALVYEQAVIEYNKQSSLASNPTPLSIDHYFYHTLNELRAPANLHMRLDDTKTELELAIESTKTVADQAKKMDDNFQTAKDNIEALGDPKGMIAGGLLSSDEWQKKRDDAVGIATLAASFVIQQKNQAQDTAYQAQVAAQQATQTSAATPPAPKALEPSDVLKSLLKDFNDPAQAANKGALRDQIHAVAYQIAVDEKNSNPQNQKSVDDIFADQLANARKIGLDKEPTDLERLRSGEKKYDALAFMEKAIEAEQKKRPHDADKAPNALELLHSKLLAINKEVEALQEKANNTTNPTERAKLELEAARVLRLYDEVSNMLMINKSGFIFKDEDARVRDSLIGSLDSKSMEALQDYLMALDAQRAELAKIAGNNAKESTPIPVDALRTTEEERTGIIKKQGDLYGNISFTERDGNNNSKSRTLEGSDGKPITGLTRADIMDAITRAENKLRIQLKDPNYKIKVTESKDGTIHYDTGNKHNRKVLHDEFVATYDLKLSNNAPTLASATLANNQQPAVTSVQHQQQPPGATAGSQQSLSGSAPATSTYTNPYVGQQTQPSTATGMRTDVDGHQQKVTVDFLNTTAEDIKSGHYGSNPSTDKKFIDLCKQYIKSVDAPVTPSLDGCNETVKPILAGLITMEQYKQNMIDAFKQDVKKYNEGKTGDAVFSQEEIKTVINAINDMTSPENVRSGDINNKGGLWNFLPDNHVKAAIPLTNLEGVVTKATTDRDELVVNSSPATTSNMSR